MNCRVGLHLLGGVEGIQFRPRCPLGGEVYEGLSVCGRILVELKPIGTSWVVPTLLVMGAVAAGDLSELLCFFKLFFGGAVWFADEDLLSVLAFD